MRRQRSEALWKTVLLDHVIPLVVGAGAATALLWQAFSRFGTHTFVGNDSGIQGLWNVWWVERALTAPTWIYDCDVMFAPTGVPLYLHDLGPTSTIPTALLSLAGLGRIGAVTVFAAITVALGLWLHGLAARRLGLGRVPSIVAGLAFALGPAHVAALAGGRISLFGATWVSLFLLTLFELLERPSKMSGALAGVSLAIVAWSDWSLLFAASIMTLFLLVGRVLGARRVASRADFWLGLGVMMVVFAVLAGPLVVNAALEASSEPAFVGGENPWLAGRDAQSLLIPGPHQLLGTLLSAPEAWASGGGYLGVVLVVLCGYAIAVKERFALTLTLAGLTLAALSLGAYLHWGGEVELSVWLPYRSVIRWVPLVGLAVDPAHLSMGAAACLTLAAAQGLWELWDDFGAKRFLGGAGAILLLAELAPAPLEVGEIPAVEGLGSIEVSEQRPAILDTHTGAELLLHQMIHGAPIVTGYGKRLPASRFQELADDPVIEQIRRPPGVPVKRHAVLEPTIDADWEHRAPHPDLPPDHFEARWRGKLLVPFSGRWRLYAELDDDAGLRVRVDDDVVIEAMEGCVTKGVIPGEASLSQGMHDLAVDYREGIGAAKVRLHWGRGDAAPTRIPETALRAEGGANGIQAEYFARVQKLPEGGREAALDELRRRGVAAIVEPEASDLRFEEAVGLQPRRVGKLVVLDVPDALAEAPAAPPEKARRRRR